jgi:hypothetical protein
MKWLDSLNDSLLSGAEWTGKNFKAVASVLTVLIVIGAVWATINYTHEKKANKALTAYAPIEKDFMSWKTPEKPNPKADEAEKKAAPPAPVDPQALFTRMTDFIKTEGDVPASELMSLMASEVAEKLGPEQQTELLDLMKKTFKNGAGVLDGLALLKKGDLLANADKCDQALNAWKEILSNKRLTYLHNTARLKSGLCLEKMSKFNEAEANYDQVIKSSEAKTDAQKTAQLGNQNQWAVKEAQKLKRALKWSQKQPSS